MDLITSLEKRFGSWAIPHLTVYLLLLQLVGVFLLYGKYSTYEDLVLVGGLVQGGQWSRLLTFMMLPKTDSLIWIIIACNIFYLTGTALEEHWGTFRYNLFVLVSFLLNVAMSFIAPSAWITNYYFIGAVFISFATIYPKYPLNIFFVLPVQVKWIGLVTAGFYLLILLGIVRVGRCPDEVLGDRLSIAVALGSYLLFFGKTFAMNLKAGQRRKAFIADRAAVEAKPLHVCTECGVSDKSDAAPDFRYCSSCGKCFCEEHIGSHEHP